MPNPAQQLSAGHAQKKGLSALAMAIGRPSIFTEELADEICGLIRDGLPIREISLRDNMPPDRTIWRWLDEKPAFRQKYASAKEVQAERQAEELLEIADNGRNDWMERHQDGEAGLVPDHEHINRSRLRVDTRKWLMSKMLPKKYGDKTTTEVTGADGAPLVPTLNVVLSNGPRRE